MSSLKPSTQNRTQNHLTVEMAKAVVLMNDRSIELKPGEDFYMYCRTRHEVIKVTIPKHQRGQQYDFQKSSVNNLNSIGKPTSSNSRRWNTFGVQGRIKRMATCRRTSKDFGRYPLNRNRVKKQQEIVLNFKSLIL